MLGWFVGATAGRRDGRSKEWLVDRRTGFTDAAPPPSMVALIAISSASAPVVQAQARSSRSYSKVEIDKKIDQIRRDLLAKIPTPEQIEALLGPVYSKADVDQKLDQLSLGIPQQTISKQDLDKALQQTVSGQDFDEAMQRTASRQDLNEAIERATDSAKAREEAIEDKLPRMLYWVAPLVSLLGVMISGGLAYYIASKAREQAETIAAAARAIAKAEMVNGQVRGGCMLWSFMISLARRLSPIPIPSIGSPTSATGSTILLTTRLRGDWIRKKWTRVLS